MKKKLLLVLMLIAAVVVMPRVYAADSVTLGEVTDITNADTLVSGTKENTITKNNDNSEVTITYDEATFKLLAEKEAEGDESDKRPEGYAWIGFRVALPTDGAEKYEIIQDGEELVAKTDIPEDDENIDVYYGFNATKLAAAAKEGKNLESTFTVNLYSEEGSETPVATQTIKVVVVPKGITLTKENSEEVEWNAEKYEEVRPAKVTVKVMKDGEEVTLDTPLSYDLVKPSKLTDEQVAAIKAALTGENLELVGLYADAEQKTAFDTTKEITDDVVVYVVYKTKVEEPAPNTLDNAVMYIALAGVSLLVAGGIAVYFKKTNE